MTSPLTGSVKTRRNQPAGWAPRRSTAAAHQVAGPAGRHRAVAVQVGGLVVGPEQGGVGDDQVDRHGDSVGGRLAGHALDQRVGHQLATGPRVAGCGPGVGVLLQGGVDRHPLGDGQQRTDACHRVGRRSAGDVAVGLGPAGATDRGARVEPVCGATGGGHHLRVAQAVQPAGVAAHLAVDLGAVLGRQQCGLAHHQLGSPLGEPALLQRGQREWHLGHPGPGGAQATAAAVRRLLASQGDLAGDASALPLRRHPGGGLSGPLGSVELDADPRLSRRGSLDFSSSSARIRSIRPQSSRPSPSEASCAWNARTAATAAGASGSAVSDCMRRVYRTYVRLVKRGSGTVRRQDHAGGRGGAIDKRQRHPVVRRPEHSLGRAEHDRVDHQEQLEDSLREVHRSTVSFSTAHEAEHESFQLR